jgi:hypothetical protein
MNKFSQVLEANNQKRYFKVLAEIELIIEAENEGEAGYTSDSILASVDGQSNFIIKNIGETSKEEFIQENKKN